MRTQREGESLREYSHALKSLMDITISKTPGGISNSDVLLRDQFIENVRDDMLRREFKQRVTEKTDIPFVDLRAIAIRWTEAVGQGGRSKPRAYSCDSYSQVADSVEANTNAVTVRSSDEISEIKECLRKQQAQLDAIMKHVTAQPPQPSRSNALFNSAKHFRFQPDANQFAIAATGQVTLPGFAG